MMMNYVLLIYTLDAYSGKTNKSNELQLCIEEFSVKRQILAFLKRKKVFSEKANFGQNSAKICLL